MEAYYEMIPAGKGHFRIGSKEAVFMDLFVGEQKALLFDTGYGFGDLRKQVRRITDLPLIIVNSHGHVDHACGNFRFEEPVYIHEKDMELCRAHTSRAMREGAVENAGHSLDFKTGRTVNTLPQEFDKEAYLCGGCGKMLPVAEGDSFPLGGMTLKIFEFPGHTAGSIGLYHEEAATMYFGDAVNSFIWLFLPESLPLSVYRESLKKAYNMELRYFYVSHDPGREEKERILDFIDAAEHVDFESGIPFQTPVAPKAEARICARAGYGPQDFDKPGFAAVVVSKEQ